MASSDSIIRNTYRQITGQEADQSIIDAARNVPDQELENFIRGGGAQAYAMSPEAQIQKMRQVVLDAFKPYEDAAKRSGEFDEKNPFIFDEALARASSQERFDPFYNAELQDFVTGVERARTRTTQDEEKIRQELTTQTNQYVGEAKRQLDEALEASREGFAGAGLFFSGKRVRREGQLESGEERQTSEFLRQQGLKEEDSQTRQTRTFEDLDLTENRQRRLLGAERETSLLTDVEKQRQEALKRREFERQQYVGFPLATGTSSLNTMLGV